MKIDLKPWSLDDRQPVIDIFNYCIENSFSAYTDTKLPYEYFDTLMNLCKGYPAVTARDETGEVIGFAMLRPYNPFPTFSKTAEITYFIRPDWPANGCRLQDFLDVRSFQTGDGGRDPVYDYGKTPGRVSVSRSSGLHPLHGSV